MGCYTVPTAAAIIHFFMRKKNPRLKADKKQIWLNHLFLGAAIFGVVDHLWNGELFMFSFMDFMLGCVITISILASWLVMVHASKSSTKAESRS
jgi:hypothetical protein